MTEQEARTPERIAQLRRVVCYGHKKKDRTDRCFSTPEAMAVYLQHEQPECFSLYWFRDGAWTTDGCPTIN